MYCHARARDLGSRVEACAQPSVFDKGRIGSGMTLTLTLTRILGYGWGNWVILGVLPVSQVCDILIGFSLYVLHLVGMPKSRVRG